MNSWSKKSLKHYQTLHQDLKLMCNTVLLSHDCSILYGHRDQVTQDRLYSEGKSKLRFPDSKHNKDPSMAVDLLPYKKDYNPYGNAEELIYGKYFCGIVLGIADALYFDGQMNHRIRWGGNWSTERDKDFASFYDGYHFELV